MGSPKFLGAPTGDNGVPIRPILVDGRHANWPDIGVEQSGSVDPDNGNVVVVVLGVVIDVKHHVGDTEIPRPSLIQHVSVVLAQTHEDILLAFLVDAVGGSEDMAIGDQDPTAPDEGQALLQQGRHPRPLVRLGWPSAGEPWELPGGNPAPSLLRPIDDARFILVRIGYDLRTKSVARRLVSAANAYGAEVKKIFELQFGRFRKNVCFFCVPHW